MCTGSSPKKAEKTAQELQGEREGQLLLNLAGGYNDVPDAVRRYATEDRTAEIQKLQGADYQQSMAAGGGYGAQQYVTSGNRISGLPSAASQTHAKGLAETRQNQGQNIFKGNLAAANYSLGATAQAAESNADIASRQTQNLIDAQSREQKASADTMNMVMGLGAIGFSGVQDYRANKLATKRHKESLAAMGGGGGSPLQKTPTGLGTPTMRPNYNYLGNNYGN